MKKSLHILITTLAIFLSIVLLQAQTVNKQVGTGNSGDKKIPIEPYYVYSWTQCIYKASEISNTGTVTHLKWYFDGTSLNVSNRWEIYIGHTSKTSFSSTSNWIPTYSMTKVYDQDFANPGGSGWITFDISDWDYNGSSNIVVAVHEEKPGYDGSSNQFRTSYRSGGNRSIYYYSDGYNPNPNSPPTARAIQPYIANIIFTINVVTPDPNIHTIVTDYDAYSITSADLDGDGDMDILGAGRNSINDISWWENNGSQVFTKRTISNSFSGAVDVFVVDMDGDGDLDVVGAADSGYGKINWWENNGNQSFTEHSVYNGTDYSFRVPQSVYAADIDGDGDIDVAAQAAYINYAYGGVSWWENNGSMSFTRHNLTTSMAGGGQIQIKDINGDNHPDLLVSTGYGNSLIWYEYDGIGADKFKPPVTIKSSWTRANSSFPIDIDNDGNMDVIAANYTSNAEVYWFSLSGTTWTTNTIDLSGVNESALYPADLDGDGDVDVLSAQMGTGSYLKWYRNDGGGSFSNQTIISQSAHLGYTRRVSVADIDSDGDMDYLMSTSGDNKLMWYENDTDPSKTVTFVDGSGFSQSISNSNTNQQIGRFQLTASAGTVSLASAEIKLNGTRSGLSNFKLWQSTDASFGGDIQVGTTVEYDPGNGKTIIFKDFVSPVEDASGSTGTYYFLTADVGTFTGGILPSIVSNKKLVLSGATHSTTINNDYLANNSTGVFIKHSIVSSYDKASSVFSIDLDQDGDMDVLGTSETETDVDWWENDGIENFTKHTINGTTIYTVKDVYAADIDGDGDLDVLTASTHTIGEITWWENDGSESFTKRSISTAYAAANSIYAADIDGDGHMDVAATSNSGSGNGYVIWFKNDGSPADGGWTTYELVNNYIGADDIYITDINNDSKPDILVSVDGTNIFWFKNNSGVSDNFDDPSSILSGSQSPTSTYAIDVNNNGYMDVLSISNANNDVTWHHTTTPSTAPWTESSISTSYTAGLDIFPTDIDGDGDVDIVTSHNSTNDLSWFSNSGGASPTFAQTDITGSFDNAKSIYSVDLDGDGDMDILAAAYDGDEVAWWEQVGSPSKTVLFVDGSDYTQTTTDGTDQPIGRFKLTASTGIVSLTSAQIILYGTRSGITNLKLWQSSNNSFGGDTQVGTAVAYDPGNAKTIEFKDFVSPVANTGTWYFLTADISSFTGGILGKLVNTTKLKLSGATHSSAINYSALSDNDLGDDYLDAATADATTTTSGGTESTAVSVSLNVGTNASDVKYVLVASSFDFKSYDNLNNEREAEFRIAGPGTQTTPTLLRQIKANAISAESWGIGTVVYIFDVSTLSDNQTFSLMHKAPTAANIYTNARITAIALSTKLNQYELDNDVKSITTAVSTSSTTFDAVTGLTTDVISLPIIGDIFVMASINSIADDAAVAQYQLESSSDGGDTWLALGRPMRRSLSDASDNGIVSLVGILQDQYPIGTYKFRVAHRMVSGTTIKTENSIITAVALAHSEGYFPAFCKADISGATTEGGVSGTFTDISSTSPFIVESARGGTGPDLFVASQYLVEASNLDVSGQGLRAANRLDLSGASTITGDEYFRYMLGNTNKGSGGYIGLMENLTGDGTYTVSIKQRVAAIVGASTAGDEALTTSEIIIAGFQNYDRPPTEPTPPAGDGSSGDPYQIATIANLLWMTDGDNSAEMSKYFIQTADIDAYETSTWNTNAGFAGIASFSGSYDGQGNTISGLTINRPAENQKGLFNTLSNGATVSNLGLINVSIIGKEQIGGIYGTTSGDFSSVVNCYVTGSVEGTGSVPGAGHSIGGIGGDGLVHITKSYSEADVAGSLDVGSFVGQGDVISDCYSTGDVTYRYWATGYVSGAFVGYLRGSCDNCYATGNVTADGPTQHYDVGFGGRYDHNPTDCFFDVTVSNQTSDAAAAATSTANMKTVSTFTTAPSDWDFAGETTNGTDNIWDQYEAINDNYPFISDMTTVIWSGENTAIWETSGNWKNTRAVPSSAKNIIIPEVIGSDPIIRGTTLRECNNITIESGGTLMIEDDASLTVSGNMVNNGTLTLESTTSGTGSLIVNGEVNGNAEVQRYVGDAAWHLVSPATTGVTSNNFYIGGSNNAWLTAFNESDDSWSYITSLTQNLAIGTGYAYWIDGSKADNTVSFTGDLRTTDVEKTLALTNNGWNLFGNPYSSVIDWNDLATADKENTTGSVYVYDVGESGNNGYKVWNGTTGSMGNGIIPVGQGFFVQTDAGDNGTSFNISTAARKHHGQAFYKSQEEDEPTMYVRIDLDEGNLGNTVFVGFPENGTDEFDFAGDAEKLYSTKEAIQMFAIENDKELCINANASLTTENNTKTVPLNLVQVIDGEYTLSISQLDQLPNAKIMLEDLQTGTIQNFVENTVYNFTASENDDAARFLLHFGWSPDGIGEDEAMASNISIYSYGKDVYIRSSEDAINQKANVFVYDMLGREILSTQIYGNQLEKITVDVENAYVVVKVVKNGFVETEKVFIK